MDGGKLNCIPFYKFFFGDEFFARNFECWLFLWMLPNKTQQTLLTVACRPYNIHVTHFLMSTVVNVSAPVIIYTPSSPPLLVTACSQVRLRVTGWVVKWSLHYRSNKTPQVTVFTHVLPFGENWACLLRTCWTSQCDVVSSVRPVCLIGPLWGQRSIGQISIMNELPHEYLSGTRCRGARGGCLANALQIRNEEN